MKHRRYILRGWRLYLVGSKIKGLSHFVMKLKHFPLKKEQITLIFSE
ncbi:hypothetical protein EC01288_3762 [Escherichia coli 0.1288]|nr:hypothetical protein EC01288_3762 [Escherichia coli 0.1288]